MVIFMTKFGTEFKKHIAISSLETPIGQCLENKLKKENWEIVPITEDSFGLYNPDFVVFFEEDGHDRELMEALHGVVSHGIQRFLYVRQSAKASYYEAFLLAWCQEHQVPLTIVMLPELLGYDGAMDRLLHCAILHEDFQLHGSETEEVPALYVEDAAFGLLQALQHADGQERIVVDIPKENYIRFMDVVLKLNSFTHLPQIKVLNQGSEFSAYKTSDAYILTVKPKYQVLEMLQQVFQKYAAADNNMPEVKNKLIKTADEADEEALAAKNSKWKKYKPYAENIGLFAVVVIISYLQGKTPVNTATGLDISYLYIIIMGILYGKSQSMPAVIPAMGLLTWGLLNQRQELISIFYQPANIFHYSTYLFLGIFTGYIADSWRLQVASAGYKLNHMLRRYGFLQDSYEKAIAIKDKLYHQIVNSEDSIGWLFGIIRQLDTVEVEDMFTQAAVVTGRVMGTENVAIYAMGKDQFYLRQKVRLGAKTRELPHSRRIEDNNYIMDMVASQNLFVNHGLQNGLPDLAAPIVYNNQVIAVIELYGLDFDQWSIYKQNLLSVTSRLVSMAMGKAYTYEDGIQSKRFVAGTRILKETEFQKLKKGLLSRAGLQGSVKNMLLELKQSGLSYQEMDRKLSGAIRQEDAVGLQDNRVYLLLHDTDDFGLDLVSKRLKNRGIEVAEVKELL